MYGNLERTRRSAFLNDRGVVSDQKMDDVDEVHGVKGGKDQVEGEKDTEK